MSTFLKFAGLLLVLTIVLSPGLALAAEETGGAAPAGGLTKLGVGLAALGAGMIAIGAGVGIGKFAAAAAEGIARQPAAAGDIKGAVNLPLFLLEGVAIIGLVVCILVVVLK